MGLLGTGYVCTGGGTSMGRNYLWYGVLEAQLRFSCYMVISAISEKMVGMVLDPYLEKALN
jgi:hypothetical protein